MNGRERILARLEGRPTDRLPNMPITMMFAADQIGAAYLDYATNYHVMADAQLRTAEAFGIDHVSVISDPAVEAADCGASVTYYPNQPPAIDEANALLADKRALHQLAARRASGALGLPGIVLLSHGADWRWMVDRPDSPWYPTLALVRQPRPDDWAAVARDLAERLRAWPGRARSGR